MRLSISFNAENRRQILFAGILTIIVVSGLFTYMVSLFAFISPTQELRWSTSISSINPPPIKRGDTVTITGFLEEGTQFLENGNYYFFPAPENIRWIVNVLDPNNTPIYFKSPTNLILKEKDFYTDVIVFTLPGNAALGTYKIRIMVWTDWLPDGETRTYLIDEKEFTVIP